MENLFLTSLLSMAALAVFFASILSFADRKLKVQDDPRVDKINHILPGVNCGACGYLSCHDFAEHIVKDDADPGKCRVLDEEARKELFELSGKDVKETVRKIAVVHCAAGTDDKQPRAVYIGRKTCGAANLVLGGSMQCEYGCMGFGDCVEVCPFDAIIMKNALPVVDINKCTACGNCVKACPRDVISLQEKKYENLFYVACKSHDTALRVREICKAGCIGCGICEKLSKEGFFKVKDNLAYPDYPKQDNQEEVEALSAKCPKKVIKKT
ncbi:MAG: RnfABCDGE type electron transport complex subunit B [Candidatus Omnitrophota bacterium]